MDVGKATDQGLAVAGFEFLEVRAIDQTGDDLPDVEWSPGILRDDAVQILGRIQRFAGRSDRHRHRLAPVEMTDDIASDGQGMTIVLGEMVGDAGNRRVDFGAAQLFGIDHLAGGRLDQGRAAQEDRALFLDDDALVAHRRDVGAAGGAGAHDHSDLGNIFGAHSRLVVEDSTEVLAVGKHLVLQGQEGATGIDQIDAGQTILAGHVLGAQVLLDGHREVGATFDRGIVGQYQNLTTIDPADTGDQPGCRCRAVVHAFGRQRAQFEKRRAGIEQGGDPITGQQLAACRVFLPGLLTATLGGTGEMTIEVIDQTAQVVGVFAERFGARIDLAADGGHGRVDDGYRSIVAKTGRAVSAIARKCRQIPGIEAVPIRSMRTDRLQTGVGRDDRLSHSGRRLDAPTTAASVRSGAVRGFDRSQRERPAEAGLSRITVAVNPDRVAVAGSGALLGLDFGLCGFGVVSSLIDRFLDRLGGFFDRFDGFRRFTGSLFEFGAGFTSRRLDRGFSSGCRGRLGSGLSRRFRRGFGRGLGCLAGTGSQGEYGQQQRQQFQLHVEFHGAVTPLGTSSQSSTKCPVAVNGLHRAGCQSLG